MCVIWAEKIRTKLFHTLGTFTIMVFLVVDSGSSGKRFSVVALGSDVTEFVESLRLVLLEALLISSQWLGLGSGIIWIGSGYQIFFNIVRGVVVLKTVGSKKDKKNISFLNLYTSHDLWYELKFNDFNWMNELQIIFAIKIFNDVYYKSIVFEHKG